jgi:hypothetical protein
MSEWKPGMVYARHTTDGRGSIEAHSCWNTDAFIAARIDDCEKANARRKPDEPVVGFEVSNRAAYFAERRRK